MEQLIDYGVESVTFSYADGSSEHHVYRITKTVTGEGDTEQVKIRVKSVATFMDEQTAYDFCDVWRGRSG